MGTLTQRLEGFVTNSCFLRARRTGVQLINISSQPLVTSAMLLQTRSGATRAHRIRGVKRKASRDKATAGEASTSARARSKGVAAAVPRARLADVGLRAEPPP